MRIRLPLTDKFLWKLYSLLENAQGAYEPFAPRTMRRVLSPEWYNLKKSYEREKAKKAFSQFIYTLKTRGYIASTNFNRACGYVATTHLKQQKEL